MRSFVYSPPSAANTTSTSSAVPPPGSKSSVPIGVIVGAAGGGVVALLAIIGSLFVLRRRRRRARDSSGKILLTSGAGGDRPLLAPAPAPAFPTPSFPRPPPSGAPVYSHVPSSGASINYNYDPSRTHMPTPPMSFTSASQRPMSMVPAPYTESLTSGGSSSLYSDAVKNQKTPLLDSKAALRPTNPSSDTQRLTETQIHLLQRLTDQNVPGPALATVIQSMTHPNRDLAAAQPGPNMSTVEPNSPGDEPPPEYNFKGV